MTSPLVYAVYFAYTSNVGEEVGRLSSAVEEAISAFTEPAAELAMTYARKIDAGGDLEKLGPQLLAVLESLLLTPKARAAAMRGEKNDSPAKSPLDELRARRAARQRGTTDLDTAAS